MNYTEDLNLSRIGVQSGEGEKDLKKNVKTFTNCQMARIFFFCFATSPTLEESAKYMIKKNLSSFIFNFIFPFSRTRNWWASLLFFFLKFSVQSNFIASSSTNSHCVGKNFSCSLAIGGTRHKPTVSAEVCERVYWLSKRNAATREQRNFSFLTFWQQRRIHEFCFRSDQPSV